MSQPTPLEQLLLELINRARLDPEGEAQRYGIDLNQGLAAGTIAAETQAPLVINGLLINAARDHSQWMLNYNVFSHTGANGCQPYDRMVSAGYPFAGSYSCGENIAWSGTTGTLDAEGSIYTHHEGLFLSPGHRVNILRPFFVEIGLGQILGHFSSGGRIYNASMVTENFAVTTGRSDFLTGVVFDDTSGDEFYSAGEGVSGVTVNVGSKSGTSQNAGGYAIMGVTGIVTVSFTGGGLATTISASITAPGGNVKLDLMNKNTLRSSVNAVLISGASNLFLLGNAASGRGNGGSNKITGNRHSNSLYGESGNDTLRGEAGNDTLLGGSGNDWLDGGVGTDSMVGGVGNDTYVVDNIGDKTIELANEGADTVRSSIAWTLGANIENLVLVGTAAINGTGNGLANRMTGNSAANVLNGGGGNDVLTGNAGNDTLRGEAGNDTLLGGTGNDWLDGGVGTDSMVGGVGNDTYVVDNIGDKTIELANEGADTVRSSIAWTLGANIENLVLVGTAAINGTGNGLANRMTGNSAANVLNGGGGNDVLTGNAGNDTLRGEAGNDTLLGGSGNDWLDGGVGTDSMVGGVGNDTYVVDNIGDKTIELANEGADTVRSSIAWTLGANIENLVLVGTAAINGTGNGLANRMTGNSAANVLNGGGGNDVLAGNAGNDTLTGGAGADQFLFNTALGGTNIDRITDFASGVDKIVLDDDIFTALTPGAFISTMFRKGAGVTTASTSAQRIVLNTTNGALYYDADGNGAGAAVQFTVLTGTSTISTVTYTDFMVVS